MTCNPHRVRVSQVVERKIVLDRRTVARINDNRPVTRVDPERRQTRANVTQSVLAPVVRPVVLDVGKGGPRGPRGERGPAGGSIPAISFSYGDAAHTIYTPESAGTLTYTRIKLNTAFNGVAPQIIIGTAADPDAAMPADYNDPKLALEYENTPDIHLDENESVILTITPDGSTQGAGLIFLEFLPD